MKNRKIPAILVLAAVGMSVFAGCGGDDSSKVESTVIFGNGVIVSPGDAIETTAGSGKLTDKTVEIPDGTYAFSVEGIQLVQSSLQVNIVPEAGNSSIKVDDNVIDDFELDVDENGKTIKLQANGEGAYQKIDCTVTLHADISSIDVGGVTRVDYTVPDNTEHAEIRAEGSSVVTVSGSCTDVIFRLSGASVVDASKLEASNAEVETEGSTKLDLHCGDSLKANASGASEINYAGNPGDVEHEVSGTASVNEK